jgi:deazaflavin-dependent oxidoreductase (nitroreductase family)
MEAQHLAAYAGADVLYLTTTGRRSGMPRTIEIWFVYHAGKLYVNAERRGAAQWVQNIMQEPRVQVRLQEHVFAARARVLDACHDRALWQTVAELSRQKYDWGEGLPVEIVPLEKK